MTRVLIDSHAHLGLALSQGAPVSRALAEFSSRPGSFLMDIGTEAGDLGPRLEAIKAAWKEAAGAGEYPQFLAMSAGLSPSKPYLDDPEASIKELEEDILRSWDGVNGEGSQGSRLPRLAAIGECGFDFHWMEGSAEEQRRLFAAQAGLAARLGLPIIVHSRKAHAATLAALRKLPSGVRALIHCFGYGPAEAREYLDSGAFISFAGNLSYKNSQDLREAAAYVPEDRLLCETDSPYLNPLPERGKPSSPLDAQRTLSLLASLRGSDEEALAESLARNARAFFDHP